MNCGQVEFCERQTAEAHNISYTTLTKFIHANISLTATLECFLDGWFDQRRNLVTYKS